MKRTLTLWLFVSAISSLDAQPVLSVPDSNGALAESAAILPLIAQGAGARSGQVEIRKSEIGLSIVGHVDGPAPNFPASTADLMRSDHVEVWLSLTPEPVFPVIGWGNQFVDYKLPHGVQSCADLAASQSFPLTPDATAKCAPWVRRQESYRTYLRRLFVRQWQLAPHLAVESFAFPAYRTIAYPKTLEPNRFPRFTASTNTAGGYDFQLTIPWDTFPPTSSETLRDVRLMVEVYSPASGSNKTGAYATTAPGRKYGEATSFNLLRLENPRKYQITPCEYPLAGLDVSKTGDEPAQGYFFPSSSTLVSNIFILENDKEGYAYEPTGMSPGAPSTQFFSREIGPEEYMCGPLLRYKKRTRAETLAIVNDEERQRDSGGSIGPRSPITVAEEGFAIRREPNGTLLIKTGPRTYSSTFGSGQCGACPRAGIAIYALHPNGTVEQAMDVETVIGNDVQDFDIQVSPDWSRIHVYTFQKRWDDTVYCLNLDQYKECGPKSHTAPPKPRNLHFDVTQ